MNKKKLSGFFAGLAGLAAAIVAARQPHPAPQPPPVDHTAEWTATCQDVWRVELGREIDPDGLANCVDAARHGAVKETIVAGVRASAEYAEHQKKLAEPPPPTAVLLSPLSVCGEFFCVDGQAWTAIETSDFSLYKRYLDGEDIAPILTERQSLGFTLLRVWLLNTSVIPGGLQPKDYPQFYDRLRPFVALCGAYGLRVEFTAFTQAPSLMPSKADQVAHWTRTQDALRGLPVLLELVNEYDHGSPPDNAPDRALFSMRPVGMLASSGSADADNAPPTPVWDYVLYHSNGLSEFQRKVGHNAMEYADQYHVPAMANENTRYPNQDASEAHAFDAAAGGALLTAGSCFHSEQGKLSTLFSQPVNVAGGAVQSVAPFAAAWVAGATAIPLEFRTGAYSRRDDLNGPTVIRAYEKRLPDGRSYVLRIRP
jgi:hypothetical protein